MRKLSLFLSATIVIFASPNLFAELSPTETQSLLQCAQQFKLITAGEDIGNTAFEEICTQHGEDQKTRLYQLFQDGEPRGILQIDSQGQIAQIDDQGNVLKICK